MANKILYVTKDSNLWDDGAGRGSGKDPHNTVGNVAGLMYTLIDFEAIPTGITGLSYARLYMFRTAGNPITGHGWMPDNGAQLIPGRITAAWTEGAKGTDHLYSLSNAVVFPGPATTGELSARGSQPASGWWYISVQEIVQSWIGGAVQYGVRLRGATGADVIFDSLQGPAANKPYLELAWTGSATNRAPDKPTNPVTSVGSDGTSFTATAKYTDPDGDISTKYQARFTPAAES